MKYELTFVRWGNSGNANVICMPFIVVKFYRLPFVDAKGGTSNLEDHIVEVTFI